MCLSDILIYGCGRKAHEYKHVCEGRSHLFARKSEATLKALPISETAFVLSLCLRPLYRPLEEAVIGMHDVFHILIEVARGMLENLWYFMLCFISEYRVLFKAQ